MGSAPVYAPGVQTILAALPALLIGAVSAALGQRRRQARTDRMLDAGWLTCAIKVASGGHHGLSGRWRHVLAKVSPGQLECRGQWYRPTAIGTFTVTAVRGPARPPTPKELWTLSAQCQVVQIQTPTATLSWAVLDQQVDGALAQLGTARDAAEPGDLLP